MLERFNGRKLVTYLAICFTLTASSAFAAVTMSSSPAYQSSTRLSAEGKLQTWTGEITTAMCKGTRSSMGHDCILNCVKTGEKFVLFTNGQPKPISNQDFADLKEHAGHRVKLTGSLGQDGTTIMVTKIEMAPSAPNHHQSPTQ